MRPGMDVVRITTSRTGVIKKRWTIILLMSSSAFLPSPSSSIIATSLTQTTLCFGVQSNVERQMMLSVFIVAYVIVLLFLGPIFDGSTILPRMLATDRFSFLGRH